LFGLVPSRDYDKMVKIFITLLDIYV
jgi:hypothetical protein